MRKIIVALMGLMMAFGMALVPASPAHAANAYTEHQGPQNGDQGPDPLGKMLVKSWSHDSGNGIISDEIKVKCDVCGGAIWGLKNVDIDIYGSGGAHLWSATIANILPGDAISRYPNVQMGKGACWTVVASLVTDGTYPYAYQTLFEGWRVHPDGPASCHSFAAVERG